MRRSVRVMIILLTVLLGLVTAGAVSLRKTAEQVVAKEINSFGDKSVAEGINLSLSVGAFDGQLIWDTEIIFSEEADSLSQVRFYQTEQNDGQTLTEPDPVRLGITIYGSNSQNHNDVEYHSFLVEGTVIQNRKKKFYSFQRLGLVELQEYDELKVFRESGYNLCRGIKYRVNPEESVYTYLASDVTETKIYYGLDLRRYNGGRPSVETFEQGYGIRCVDYCVKEVNGKVTLELPERTPELICDLDPKEMLLCVEANEEKGELYIITTADNVCYVYIVDLHKEKTIQKLELTSYDEGVTPWVKGIICGENVIIPILVKGVSLVEQDDEKLAVVAIGEDGQYELQFVIDKEDDVESSAYQYQKDTYWREATLWERDPVSVEAVYRDGRLAMVYSLTNSYGNNAGGWESQRPACFWLAVYDETGVVYAADFQMSQGVTEYSNAFDRDDICEIRDNVEIGISWGE